MAEPVIVTVRYTLPGAPDTDSLHLELHTRPGAHLSIMFGEAAGSKRDGTAAPVWLPQALAAIRDAGPDGLKPSQIAELVGRDRRTIRLGLRNAVECNEVTYRSNGPHSVYVCDAGAAAPRSGCGF
ncbi:hypothetical protein ACJ6WF_49235 [Streptomyces sp. MMS24-I2-30]|uniref:hypothetical protein n=1 Tax=Streptomyces sp. MMS24-I2-30 TaxID=3351564 RepID=UPI00389688D1